LQEAEIYINKVQHDVNSAI